MHFGSLHAQKNDHCGPMKGMEICMYRMYNPIGNFGPMKYFF